MRHDVIICGCGPAGATAGLALARSGRSVLMLDKTDFPRPKLCGGLLTWKTARLVETVFGETMADLTAAGIVTNASDRFVIRSSRGVLAQGALLHPFHFADRARFDARLLEHAQRAGAQIKTKSRVTACDPGKAGDDTHPARVTLADGTVLEADTLIGADGANSVVRNSFPGIDKARFARNMAPAIEVALAPSALPEPVDCPQLHVGLLEAGYGWVFPAGESVLVGICGLRRNNVNFSSLFRDFIDYLKIDPAVVPPLRGHPLPYGNALDDPTCGRALLAGDAGGFVEPLFGEGIFYALCTGLYAGQAVAEASGRASSPLYIDRLRRDILPELRWSDRLRWLLFRSMQLAGPRSLGLFVNSGPSRLAEMVHGLRSFAWLRRKRWSFLEQ
ncbi:geranylgeranyl reductase family protein [Pseudodesulfovibrio sp. F-1]|uniref:Geranylgeranyl reductase family protein n=1 Tax=Pseudodesulfovibrio alkaliphilus TaxID=2661613 RepID=A0A7K1KNS0_9BACT|nr:geranylgeranyl reductase family protein [Pseudodesulfovibrio alkaliphilus]MUM77542.1 geranylgeranyl reductase family protein [Pseudodesulfovibrio alkaliphilus]